MVGWLAPTFQPADLLWGGTVGWLSLFISILLTLYLRVMDFGYRLWALRVTRSQQAGYGTLLEGFGIAGRVIAMNLLILLFTFLWSLLLIFVTTILAFLSLIPCFATAGDGRNLCGSLCHHAPLCHGPLPAGRLPGRRRRGCGPPQRGDDAGGASGSCSSCMFPSWAGNCWASCSPCWPYLPFLTGILAQVNSVAQFYSVLFSLIPARWSGLPDQSAPHPVADPLPHGGGGLFYRSIWRDGRPPRRRRRRADVRRNVGTAQR